MKWKNGFKEGKDINEYKNWWKEKKINDIEEYSKVREWNKEEEKNERKGEN